MEEIWKDIEGYEGYEVSNLGRVKSLDYRRTGAERVLKPAYSGNGYLFVNLYKDGKEKKHYIHRLVAAAFIPNPHNLPEINHINEQKEDNRVENLEWCTQEYNRNYGTRNERVAKAFSKPVLQLTLDGELMREWPSTHEAHRQGGYNQGTISACCRGIRNTHKGYVWKYKAAANW